MLPVNLPIGAIPLPGPWGRRISSHWTAQWIGRDDGPTGGTSSLITQSQWIWYPEGSPASDVPVATRYFRESFTACTGVTVTQATVFMTADNQFNFDINGQTAITGGESGMTPSPLMLRHRLPAASTCSPSKRRTSRAPRRIPRDSSAASPSHSATGKTIPSGRMAHGLPPTNHNNWNLPEHNPGTWPTAMVLWLLRNCRAPSAPVTRPPRTCARISRSRNAVRAVLYVTAEGLIEPHLNGAKVGNDDFVPGWTNYNDRIYYTTYDVTSDLHAGVNTLGAIFSATAGFAAESVGAARTNTGRRSGRSSNSRCIMPMDRARSSRRHSTWKAGSSAPSCKTTF